MKDESSVSLEKKEAVESSGSMNKMASGQADQKSNAEIEDKEIKNETPKKIDWVQIRAIPIIVRVILVLLILAIVSWIGLRIGYGYMGDGDPSDVLKKETWTHITDIIKGQ